MNRREAEKAIMNIALDQNFVGPADAAFPLGSGFAGHVDRGQSEVLRGYLGQLRQEIAARLVERLFASGDEKVSKVSLLFQSIKSDFDKSAVRHSGREPRAFGCCQQANICKSLGRSESAATGWHGVAFLILTDHSLSQWWLSFSKRKFMGKSL